MSAVVNAEVLNIGIGNRLEIGATAFSSGPRRLFVNNEGDREIVGGTQPLVNAKLSLLSPRSPIQLVGGVIDALDYVERTPYVYGSFNVGPMIHRLPLTTLPRVSARLRREGLSETDIAKIMGGNLLRVLRQVQAAAARP